MINRTGFELVLRMEDDMSCLIATNVTDVCEVELALSNGTMKHKTKARVAFPLTK